MVTLREHGHHGSAARQSARIVVALFGLVALIGFAGPTWAVGSDNTLAVGAAPDHELAADSAGITGQSQPGGPVTGKVRAKKAKYVEVAVGGAHTCGLQSNGQVRCWGAKKWNQTNDPKPGFVTKKPIRVKGIPSLAEISAGFRHTCGVSKDGRAFCWGENSSGELGAGTTASSGCNSDTGCPNTKGRPVAVTGLGAVSSVVAGTQFTCAVSADSAVLCWGRNDRSQLGDGSTSLSLRPVPTAITTGAASLALGDQHACALVTGGEVRCWGANSYGQLGGGPREMIVAEPVTAELPGPAKAIVAGFRHTCAELTSGALYCWGDNRLGQLGDGTKTARPSPVKVSGSKIDSMAAGGRNTCVVTGKRKVQCWGDNGDGQLGQGKTKKLSGKKTVKKLSSVSRVSIGYAHVCAVSKGGIKCWGINPSFQLGNGANKPSYVPVSVKR